MKALLDNRLAPVTFTWGFVERPFSSVSEPFIQWQTDLDAKFGTRTELRSFRAPLSESLLRLEPLTTPQDRYLLAATPSGWSAIFANGLRTNDVQGPASYLPTILRCHGLEIACVPDRSARAGTDGIQIYGALKFALYGPDKRDWGNTVRSISLTNDVGGWRFATEGEVQPYEQVENYRRRKVVDRFSAELLDAYCSALGIDLFSPGFYGEQCVLSHTKNRAPGTQGPAMSIADARAHLYIGNT